MDLVKFLNLFVTVTMLHSKELLPFRLKHENGTIIYHHTQDGNKSMY